MPQKNHYRNYLPQLHKKILLQLTYVPIYWTNPYSVLNKYITTLIYAIKYVILYSIGYGYIQCSSVQFIEHRFRDLNVVRLGKPSMQNYWLILDIVQTPPHYLNTSLKNFQLSQTPSPPTTHFPNNVQNKYFFPMDGFSSWRGKCMI